MFTGQIYKEDVTNSLFTMTDLIRHRTSTFITPSFIFIGLFFKSRQGIVASRIQHFTYVVNFKECRSATFAEATA